MSISEYREIAGIIQALVVSLSITAGGVWALFRFRKLQELDKAKAELKKLYNQLKERGAISVELVLQQLVDRAANPDARFIEVTATLHNSGNRAEIIDWSDGGVLCHKYRPDAPLDFEMKDPSRMAPASLNGVYKGSTISPESSRTFVFLVPVGKPGLYIISFFARSSPREQAELVEEHEQVFENPIGEFYWTADAFFEVA